MKIKQTLLIMAVLISINVFAHSPAALASTCDGVKTSLISCNETLYCSDASKTHPFEGSDPGSDKTSKAAYSSQYGHSYGKCPKGSTPVESSTGLWGLLTWVINILTAGVGVAAVGGIVYGSLMYASAGPNPEQVKKARGIITNTVIGILVFALMYALLNYIIPGGLIG